MAKKRRAQNGAAGKKRAANQAGSSKPRDQSAQPLLSLTRHGFSALRARVHAPAEGEGERAPGKRHDGKQDRGLAEALERLEADYDRVLKPK